MTDSPKRIIIIAAIWGLFCLSLIDHGSRNIHFSLESENFSFDTIDYMRTNHPNVLKLVTTTGKYLYLKFSLEIVLGLTGLVACFFFAKRHRWALIVLRVMSIAMVLYFCGGAYYITSVNLAFVADGTSGDAVGYSVIDPVVSALIFLYSFSALCSDKVGAHFNVPQSG